MTEASTTTKKPARKKKSKKKTRAVPLEQVEAAEEAAAVADSVPEMVNIDDVVASYSRDEVLEAMKRAGVVPEDATIAVDVEELEPDEEADAQTERREKLDDYIARVGGLRPDSRLEVSFVLERKEPEIFEGVNTVGYCRTLHLPFTLENIRNEFGGGTYELTGTLPGENRGQNKPISDTCRFAIVGPPLLGTLSKDRKEGVSYAPPINTEMQSLRAEIVKLQSPRAGPFDDILKLLAPIMVKKVEEMMNPAPPPPQATIGERMSEVVDLMKAVQAIVPAPQSSDTNDSTDPDDDSPLAEFLKSSENVSKLVDSITGTVTKLAKKRPAAPAAAASTVPATAAAPTQPTEEDADAAMHGLVTNGIHRLWGHLLAKNKRVATIAKDMIEYLKGEAGDNYDAVVAFLTYERVMTWLQQSAETDEHRSRLSSKRGKDKIRQVVGMIRGEIAMETKEGAD